MEQQLAILYEAAWQRATREEQQALAAVVGLNDRAEPSAVFTSIARQARRLDPGLAVRRRVQVEPDDVPQLGDELRVVGQLEGAHPVRPELVRAPDPQHRAGADPDR